MVSCTCKVSACLQLSVFWSVSIRQCLHVGHEECEQSRVSIQCIWNPWLHLGKIRRHSPAANSNKQITQAVSRPGSFNSVAYFTTGKAFKALCSTPKLANLGEGEIEPLIAHLTIQNKPHEEMMVQMRTKITMGAFVWRRWEIPGVSIGARRRNFLGWKL
ncbi:hypothetical protein V6N13_126737 [Hibiscus sabdariffa]